MNISAMSNVRVIHLYTRSSSRVLSGETPIKNSLPACQPKIEHACQFQVQYLHPTGVVFHTEV